MRYILNLGTIFALILLILIRIFSNEGGWMVGIQYIGLGIAYLDLFSNILGTTKKIKIFKKVLGIMILFMLICIIIAILGSLQIVGILAEQKAMDIVTLITLLLSLPQKLYLRLLEER